jgi:hypothetical protein
MTSRLNILALEPFYGGVRRQMLQTLMRLSRHRWSLLKLPARRVERRLAASARWFAELIGRIDIDNVNLLFTSEMLNLPELFRMVPKLARRPSLVYFHDNQTPTLDPESHTSPLDLVNVSSAMAATELWFSSQYHQDSFFQKTEALVEHVPEIAGQNPVSELLAKSLVMPPPVDLARLFAVVHSGSPVYRDSRALFVDLREIDVTVLLEVLRRLDVRGEPFNLITVGPQKGLPDSLRRTSLSETDETAQYRAMHEAAIFVGLRYGATSDELIVPALSAGCWPVVPDAGLYSELLPPMLHLTCMHDGSVESILGRILDVWNVERPPGCDFEQNEILSHRDAVVSCRLIDDLLEEVAVGRAIRM